jgi:hypothetical protein
MQQNPPACFCAGFVGFQVQLQVLANRKGSVLTSGAQGPLSEVLEVPALMDANCNKS